MRIYGKCKFCDNEITYSTYTKTRVEFAMSEGENKTLKCQNCRSETSYHVDELFTKESKAAQIGAALIFLIGTPLTFFTVNPLFIGRQNHYTFYIIGGFLFVPIIVYGIILKQERNKVNGFNRHKLKGNANSYSIAEKFNEKSNELPKKQESPWPERDGITYINDNKKTVRLL